MVIQLRTIAVCIAMPAAVASCILTGSAGNQTKEPGDTVLFEEPFEDTNWSTRGWYDNPRFEITDEEHIPGSSHSCVWHWKKAGDISPSGGAARVLLPPTESVRLSFHIKHSANWTWTGVNWHPHEFQFLTTEDDSLIGPAYTHLTFYIEAVNGVPRLAIQDSRNIDESRVGEDLVAVTENRAVAGGNGDSDGYGEGDSYPVGAVHRNGKFWEAVALIIEHRDVVFRTGQHPGMKINQFMMAPYYGPGVPHEQKIWIDDLKITTGDIL